MCTSLQSDSRSKVSDTSVFAHTIHIDLAVAWSAQLVFDTFIFLLTLMQSLRIRKERSRSIVEIILRDGVFRTRPSAETYTDELLGSLYFACVEDLFGEISNVAEATSYLQDNVCNQCCERSCVIGESYSRVPPYFPDANLGY